MLSFAMPHLFYLSEVAVISSTTSEDISLTDHSQCASNYTHHNNSKCDSSQANVWFSKKIKWWSPISKKNRERNVPSIGHRQLTASICFDRCEMTVAYFRDAFIFDVFRIIAMSLHQDYANDSVDQYFSLVQCCTCSMILLTIGLIRSGNEEMSYGPRARLWSLVLFVELRGFEFSYILSPFSRFSGEPSKGFPISRDFHGLPELRTSDLWTSGVRFSQSKKVLCALYPIMTRLICQGFTKIEHWILVESCGNYR